LLEVGAELVGTLVGLLEVGAELVGLLEVGADEVGAELDGAEVGITVGKLEVGVAVGKELDGADDEGMLVGSLDGRLVGEKEAFTTYADAGNPALFNTRDCLSA